MTFTRHIHGLGRRLAALATLCVCLAPLAAGLAAVSTSGPVLTSCCHHAKGCCCRRKDASNSPGWTESNAAEKCSRSCASVSPQSTPRLGAPGTLVLLARPASRVIVLSRSSQSRLLPRPITTLPGRAPPLA